MSADLSTKRTRWGYDPNYIRCTTSDPEGNVLKVWFEPVVRGTVSRLRLMMLVAVSASLAAFMALQAVQQAFSAG
jgi:hypothetical protein